MSLEEFSKKIRVCPKCRYELGPYGEAVPVYVQRDDKEVLDRTKFRQQGWRCVNQSCGHTEPMRSRAIYTTNERGPAPRNF